MIFKRSFLLLLLLFNVIHHTTSSAHPPTSSISSSNNNNGDDTTNSHNNDHQNQGHQLTVPTKPRGSRGKNSLKTRDLGHFSTSNSEGFCELEVHCRGESMTGSLPVRLPIKGARGPPGPPGERGERGADGGPGYPGLPGQSLKKKVAFFVGLTDNFGPVDENSDIIFDRVVTNVGSAYNPATGRFTAPVTGVYQFNVIVSAQGREKAAVMVLKNGEMMATVWAESIPYWATSSNIVVLNLYKGDQVWLLLLSRASHLHGYMYTTFSGFIVFDL